MYNCLHKLYKDKIAELQVLVYGYCVLVRTPDQCLSMTDIIINTEAKVSIPSSLCSGVFYKIGKAEGSFPSVHDTTTLWQWVKEINKATGSDLRAIAHIMGTAWKQAQRSAIH